MTENFCGLEEKCPKWPDCHSGCVWRKFARERYNQAIEDVINLTDGHGKWLVIKEVKALRKKVYE